ncbi:MAG: M23 family metallopeptidase [Elusimicrobiota bacterium]
MYKKIKNFFNKKLTLIFAPEKGGRSFHLSLSYPFIMFMGLFAAGIFTAGIYISGIYISYYEILSTNREILERKKAYAEQTEEALSLLDNIRNVETRLASMIGMENKRNIIENYPLGGPDPDFVIPSELDSIFEFNRLKANIKEFKKEAWQQNQSASQIEGFLKRKKDFLLSTPSIWPVFGYITSGFGYRTHPITKKKEFHRAIDIYNSLGANAPVRVTARGRVILAGWAGAAGRTIVVDHGNGFSTRYMHLSDMTVEQGDRVEQGQIVGYIGRTGRTTGNHLHYEVWYRGEPVNPVKHVRGR